MLFLVTGENIDSGYLLPPAAAMDIIEQAVVPSFQIMGSDPRVKGGVFPGERGGACVIEVESFEELDRFMNSLPFFGLVKWNVKPLMPFATIARQLPEYIANVRAMTQGAPAGSGE
jgi:hypothetical protein